MYLNNAIARLGKCALTGFDVLLSLPLMSVEHGVDGDSPRDLDAVSPCDVFNAAFDAILVVDVIGNVVEANYSSVQLIGYSRDELLGMPIGEILPYLKLYTPIGDIRNMNLQLQDADGLLVPVRVNSVRVGGGMVAIVAQPIRYGSDRDWESELIGIAAINDIISAMSEKRDLDSLIATALTAFSLVSGMEMAGILVRDEEAAVVSVLPRHNLPGKLADVLDGMSLEHPFIQRILARGETVLAEGHGLMARLELPSDAIAGVSAMMCIPLMAGGRVEGMVVLATKNLEHPSSAVLFGISALAGGVGTLMSSAGLFDPDYRRRVLIVDYYKEQDLEDRLEALARRRIKIFERAHAELMAHNRGLMRIMEAIQRDKEQLIESNSKLISTLSHELRASLNSIKLYVSSFLEHGFFDSDRLRRAFTTIDAETDRLMEMINNLLDEAAMEAGRLTVKIEAVDVIQVINEAVESISRRDEDPINMLPRHTIKTEIPTEMPIVRANKSKVRQILYNLLDNAIKYTPKGTLIVVRASARASDVLIEVRDYGDGISPDEIEAIFERFRRGSKALSSGPDGVGLGLAVCKELAGALGGELWAESELGKGASFFLRLPIEADRKG